MGLAAPDVLSPLSRSAAEAPGGCVPNRCPKHRGCTAGLCRFFTAKHSTGDAGKDEEDLGDASVVLACSPIPSPEGPGGVQERTGPVWSLMVPWRGSALLPIAATCKPWCSSRLRPCSRKVGPRPGHVRSSQVRPELCACRHPPPPALAQMPPQKASCLARDA